MYSYMNPGALFNCLFTLTYCLRNGQEKIIDRIGIQYD